ncbi:TNFAIP3-interacting protein 3 isoform X2 [Ambystoma mexicanum]|uniref:TNFAIP3-interacting protein 3 isoform X2 n=1 Tax=Ambystoma mexicanum TaxID=8296 RepID=UPI0037E78D5C
MDASEYAPQRCECIGHEEKHENMPPCVSEHKIKCLEKQRQELLEVNKQWDHQFRNMKILYEKKIAEMKEKLHACQSSVMELERKYNQNQSELVKQKTRAAECLEQEMKEKYNLNVELDRMREQNDLLMKHNLSLREKKEQRETEIRRLNEVLLETFKKDHISGGASDSKRNVADFDNEEMITQIEVLKHQMKIYEDDFKKERSDRERINEEKEELHRSNRRMQDALKQLNSKIIEERKKSMRNRTTITRAREALD